MSEDDMTNETAAKPANALLSLIESAIEDAAGRFDANDIPGARQALAVTSDAVDVAEKLRAHGMAQITSGIERAMASVADSIVLAVNEARGLQYEGELHAFAEAAAARAFGHIMRGAR